MSRILLIDTNFSALPVYQYLIQNNNEVFVVGGNPGDALAKSVRNYINLDYSNLDKTRDLIDKHKIDYILPGCNDRSYLVCSELNEKGNFYGIDTLEVTETINNKKKFRAFAVKVGLPVPKVFSNEKEINVWPLIIKPVDAYSGRGTTLLRETEKEKLGQAIKLAEEFSRSKSYIIEEYIEGQLYSHSAFISDGKIYIDFIVEEHGTANPFVVDTSRVVFDFGQKVLHNLRDTILLMAKELNLVDGLVHTQFIKKGERIWLIEITRRCPGDLYSQLIEMSTGFPYAEMYARPFLNQNISRDQKSLKHDYILRHTISQLKEDYFSSLEFNFPVHIEKFVPLSLSGEKVKGSPGGRIGLLFLRTNSEYDLINLFQVTLNRELYSIC
ncbi:MAG: ATP-grasp domain-containing protein [Lentimicrobiaceae bacterium]|nr:ATP-grasp domain-containing protein [Lentimicrobiaceae bacterium]